MTLNDQTVVVIGGSAGIGLASASCATPCRPRHRRGTVRIEDVPRCVQGRIRWWGAHNSAFLLGSAVLVAIGWGALALA